MASLDFLTTLEPTNTYCAWIRSDDSGMGMRECIRSKQKSKIRKEK